MQTEAGLNPNHNLEHLQSIFKITLLKGKVTNSTLYTILLSLTQL